jgi:imidazoleglycerol-phosphate dehydratase
VGSLPVTLIRHFFRSFAHAARASVHARVLYGEDDHHQVEALFKALGRALDAATQLDPRRAGSVASTKGML